MEVTVMDVKNGKEGMTFLGNESSSSGPDRKAK
jgi:hypothetical protein